MTTRKNERRNKVYLAFYCDPKLKAALLAEAEREERTQSQQLRFMLANALATRPEAAHVAQPTR